MKLTQKQYLMFKKECKKWQKRFGLDNWSVVYQFKEINADACITRSEEYNATIALDKEIDTQFDYDMSINDYIKQCAKHEVIHLLLGRMYVLAKSTDYTISDYTDEEESVVRKLIQIIK